MAFVRCWFISLPFGHLIFAYHEPPLSSPLRGCKKRVRHYIHAGGATHATSKGAHEELEPLAASGHAICIATENACAPGYLPLMTMTRFAGHDTRPRIAAYSANTTIFATRRHFACHGVGTGAADRRGDDTCDIKLLNTARESRALISR